MSEGEKNALFTFFTELMKPESIGDLQIGIASILILSLTCSVFYVASNDPTAITDKFYLYCVFGILPAIVGVFLTVKMFGGPIDVSTFSFYGCIFFIFIISIYLFRRVLNPSSVQTTSYILVGLISAISIFGLAIVYRIFVRTIMNTRGWLGFFLKFLFLIPCLVIDLMESVFVELKNTSNMVIALFILEILIILAYIYIPSITRPSTNSVLLLDKPLFLTNVQPIGKANQLFMDINEVENPSKAADTIRHNYSISMWIQVNQHSNNFAAYSKETNIFRYGYPNYTRVGHPKVTYFNDVNDKNKSDKLIVYVNSMDESGTLLDMLSQSWNQLVVSYNKSVVDIFVNGDLVKTQALAYSEVDEYDSGDIIEVGEGDNTFIRGGLHGAICNVVYFKSPLTPFQVANEYNLYRYKTPPV